jgi:hypothetical protein
MKLMIALLLLTQHLVSPPPDERAIDLNLQSLLTEKEFRDYTRKTKYRDRMDLFRKVFVQRSILLEQYVHENKMEESSEILRKIRALCPHVKEESSNVEKVKDLRSKQVKKLEIHLRKFVKAIQDLQTVAPVEYVEQFELTAADLERLRRVLLTQVLGYSMNAKVRLREQRTGS